MDLSGRVAIVTGGGTGIGRATSLRLAKSGVKAVVINYSRSAREAEKTAEELRRLAAEAQIVAETTVDAHRKRALSVIALNYKRLAEFVRLKAEASGAKTKTPQIPS